MSNCITFLLLFGLCLVGWPSTAQFDITGRLLCYGDQPFTGVSLILKSDQGGPLDTAVTDEEGKYAFENLPSGAYELFPRFRRNVLFLGDITSVDLNLMQQYLLQQRIASPLIRQAMDINRDGRVSIQDQYLLDLYVNGIPIPIGLDFFIGWRFFNADSSRSLRIGNLDRDIRVDIIGIYRGDLNGSACP